MNPQLRMISLHAGMAIGSYAFTRAPICTNRSAICRLGASRRSSVSGLNASPSNAMVRPFRMNSFSCSF